MTPNRPVRRSDGDDPRPGLFQSVSETILTFGFWLLASLPIAFVIGIWCHILYFFFRQGWDLL